MSVVATTQESLTSLVARHLTPGRERALLVLFLGVVVYPCYFVLGRAANPIAGHHPALWIDLLTPLTPGWIYVYAHVFFVGFLPAAVVRCPMLFRRAAGAYLLTMLVAFVVFITLPVTMTLQPSYVQVDSFATWGLALTYWLDEPVNCFPSLHVALSVLSGLICWKVDRVVGGITLLLAVAIAASTMLVKQHYFVDVVGGGVLALLANSVFVAKASPMASASPVPGEAAHFSRWVPVAVGAIYWAIIGGLYVAYRAQWMPWQA